MNQVNKIMNFGGLSNIKRVMRRFLTVWNLYLTENLKISEALFWKKKTQKDQILLSWVETYQYMYRERFYSQYCIEI